MADHIGTTDMSHHVKHMIRLEYLETARHTKWQLCYRMQTQGAQNMKADAEARGWHMWRIVLEDAATGATVGTVEQAYSQPTEPGADGLPQLVIPGAERVSVAQLIQRRIDAPKAPTKPQRRADHGLFDTGARDQLSMF